MVPDSPPEVNARLPQEPSGKITPQRQDCSQRGSGFERASSQEASTTGPASRASFTGNVQDVSEVPLPAGCH